MQILCHLKRGFNLEENGKQYVQVLINLDVIVFSRSRAVRSCD